jgi:hypothetical protein
MSGINGLDALGYMLSEYDRLVAIRNFVLGKTISYEDLKSGSMGLVLMSSELLLSGWEIGWKCEECDGDGQVTIPCPRCSGKSLHNLLENPCCGGWDEVECSSCEGGIRWEKEY